MAFSVKTGYFLDNATSVTGLTFQPKAVFAFYPDFSDQFYPGITLGMCDSALSQVNVQLEPGRTRVRQANSFISKLDNTASLTGFTSGGFTLNRAAGSGASYVSYMAFGGTDITDTKVLAITPPSSTGDQTYTLGFEPDALIFIGNNYSGGDYANQTPNYLLGFATKSGLANAVTSCSIKSGEEVRRSRADKCVSIFNTSASEVAQASLTGTSSTGFTLTWSAATSPLANIYVLAIKGGSYKLSSFLKSTAAATAVQPVTGVGFQPAGLLFTTSSISPDAATNYGAAIAIGSASGTTSATRTSFEYSKGAGSAANLANPGKAITSRSAAGNGATSYCNVSSFDSDGFTLAWNPNDTGNSPRIFYLAAGTAVVSTPVTVLPVPNTAAWTVPDPTVTAEKNVTVTDTVGTASFTLLDPVVTAEVSGVSTTTIATIFALATALLLPLIVTNSVMAAPTNTIQHTMLTPSVTAQKNVTFVTEYPGSASSRYIVATMPNPTVRIDASPIVAAPLTMLHGVQTPTAIIGSSNATPASLTTSSEMLAPSVSGNAQVYADPLIMVVWSAESPYMIPAPATASFSILSPSVATWRNIQILPSGIPLRYQMIEPVVSANASQTGVSAYADTVTIPPYTVNFACTTGFRPKAVVLLNHASSNTSYAVGDDSGHEALAQSNFNNRGTWGQTSELQSFTSTGFGIAGGSQSFTQYRSYLAIGGPDVDAKAWSSFSNESKNGNDWTYNTGLADPDCILFITTYPSASDTTLATQSVGIWTKGGSQQVVATANKYSVGQTAAKTYEKSGQVAALFYNLSQSVSVGATGSVLNVNGSNVTIRWSSAPTNGASNLIGIAFKGATASLTTFNKTSSAAPTTQHVSIPSDTKAAILLAGKGNDSSSIQSGVEFLFGMVASNNKAVSYSWTAIDAGQSANYTDGFNNSINIFDATGTPSTATISNGLNPDLALNWSNNTSSAKPIHLLTISAGTSVTSFDSPGYLGYTLIDPVIAVERNALATPAPISAQWTSLEPAFYTATLVYPDQFTTAVTLHQPTVLSEIRAFPEPLTAGFTLVDPIVRVHVTTTPAPISAAYSIGDPAVVIHTTEKPYFAPLSFVLVDPQVHADVRVSPAINTAALTVVDPIIKTNSVITASPFNVGSTIPAPTLKYAWTQTATPSTAQFGFFAPVISANVVVSPGANTASFTILNPVVTGDALCTPSPLALVPSIQPVTFKLDWTQTVTPISAQWTVTDPNVGGLCKVTPDPISASCNLLEPEVRFGWKQAVGTISAGFTLNQPTVHTDQNLSVGQIGSTFVFPAPMVGMGVALPATPISVTTVILTPAINLGIGVLPTPGAASFTINEPLVSVGAVLEVEPLTITSEFLRAIVRGQISLLNRVHQFPEFSAKVTTIGVESTYRDLQAINGSVKQFDALSTTPKTLQSKITTIPRKLS